MYTPVLQEFTLSFNVNIEFKTNIRIVTDKEQVQKLKGKDCATVLMPRLAPEMPVTAFSLPLLREGKESPSPKPLEFRL